jgi:hypothetical protein
MCFGVPRVFIYPKVLWAEMGKGLLDRLQGIFYPKVLKAEMGKDI